MQMMTYSILHLQICYNSCNICILLIVVVLKQVNNFFQVEHKAPVLAISKAPTVTVFQTKMEWAEQVDISKPMDDFEERVPDMAFKYRFELDTFQKQVIVDLKWSKLLAIES